MKICLFNPPRLGFRFGESFEPLGLLYLSAYLKEKGFTDIFLIDADNERLNLNDSFKKFKKTDPDLVLFSVLAPTEKFCLLLAKKIKEYNSDCTIVFGGMYPTTNYVEIFNKSSNVDFIVLGEGEQTCHELCSALAKNKSTDKIVGLAFTVGKKIVKTKDRKLIQDLNVLPLPDRDILPKDFYSKTKVSYFMTQRGCPYKCSFCLSPIVWKTVRWFSPKRVLKEVEDVVSKYGIEHIFFWDDVFLSNAKRATEILTGLTDFDLTFSCYNRVEAVNKKLLAYMAKAGCTKIKFGVETANPEHLALLNKRLRIETIKKSIKNTKNAGIFCHTSFQIGLPNETKESINNTLELAKTLMPDYAYFFLFLPYPGSKIFNTMKDKLITKDYSKFWLFNPVIKYDNFTAREILSELANAWYKYYHDKIGISPLTTPNSENLVNYIYQIQSSIYSDKDKIKF